MIKKILIICGLFLFSCTPKKISHEYPDNPDYARKSRAGMLFSDTDLTVFGAKKNTKSEEKKFTAKSALWKASNQVIGALFPIANINLESGLIITEWHEDNNSSQRERTKINAFVKGEDIKKENLQIVIFRQKEYNGSWKDLSREDSDKGGILAVMIQEKILEKAKK